MKFVPNGPINNISALAQIMAWRQAGDKPLSEPLMVRLPTHYIYSEQHEKIKYVLEKKKWPHCLTHWGWMTHICISNLTIIGSDNGLLPGRRQAIIWTNDGILLIGPLGTNFNKILIKIYISSSKKMPLKMSSGKWRSFCLGLNVLRVNQWSLSNPQPSSGLPW